VSFLDKVDCTQLREVITRVMIPRHVFYNSDVGEGAGFDAEIIPMVEAVNICCGAHAGNLEEMQRAVELAQEHGVCIGAHPGFADREHFGRREQQLSDTQLHQLLFDQLDTLDSIAGGISYIKPHGALYNMMSRDAGYAVLVLDILREWREIPVMLLAGSVATKQDHPSMIIAEGFMDRRYTAEGLLVPRTKEHAVIASVAEASAQAAALRRGDEIISESGTALDIPVDSICVHGDSAGAVDFLRRCLAEAE